MTAQRSRLAFLDGIRGWSAFMVLLDHVFLYFFPLPADWVGTATLKRFFLFNGDLAVWIFFIISGFSLSVGYARERKGEILAKIALARYLRLAIPVCAVVLIMYAGYHAGLVPPVADRPVALQHPMRYPDSLWETLRLGLFGAFYDYRFGDSMISPLWTMQYELVGSMLALLSQFVVRGHRDRYSYYFLIFSVLAVANAIYGLFIVGIVMAEIYVSHMGETLRAWMQRYTAYLLPLAIILAGALPGGRGAPLPYLLVAIFLCFLFIFAPYPARLMSARPSVFLGKIAFSLYLLHFPVLWMAGIPLFNTFPYPGMQIVIVAICIICAMIFEPVDRRGHAFARRLASRILRYVTAARNP